MAQGLCHAVERQGHQKAAEAAHHEVNLPGTGAGAVQHHHDVANAVECPAPGSPPLQQTPEVTTGGTASVPSYTKCGFNKFSFVASYP